MTVMCLLLFVLPVSKKKIVDAGWVRVEFGQSGADGAPDFLGFGAFPWFSRFEVICKGGEQASGPDSLQNLCDFLDVQSLSLVF